MMDMAGIADSEHARELLQSVGWDMQASNPSFPVLSTAAHSDATCTREQAAINQLFADPHASLLPRYVCAHISFSTRRICVGAMIRSQSTHAHVHAYGCRCSSASSSSAGSERAEFWNRWYRCCALRHASRAKWHVPVQAMPGQGWAMRSVLHRLRRQCRIPRRRAAIPDRGWHSLGGRTGEPLHSLVYA